MVYRNHKVVCQFIGQQEAGYPHGVEILDLHEASVCEEEIDESSSQAAEFSGETKPTSFFEEPNSHFLNREMVTARMS